MKRCAVTVAALALVGCASIATDQYGNEARPFGVDESPTPRMEVREVASRAELIVQCHDLQAQDEWAYVSRDGLNCVVFNNTALNSDDPSCTVWYVKDAQRDDGWVNAICQHGWIPGAL